MSKYSIRVGCPVIHKQYAHWGRGQVEEVRLYRAQTRYLIYWNNSKMKVWHEARDLKCVK